MRMNTGLLCTLWHSPGDLDGSLPDDDWLLARGLGMPETDWRSYRDTLIKTSWLIVQDGRLTNSIVMREFLNAQKALMDAIERGHKGGKEESISRRPQERVKSVQRLSQAMLMLT